VHHFSSERYQSTACARLIGVPTGTATDLAGTGQAFDTTIERQYGV